MDWAKLYELMKSLQQERSYPAFFVGMFVAVFVAGFAVVVVFRVLRLRVVWPASQGREETRLEREADQLKAQNRHLTEHLEATNRELETTRHHVSEVAGSRDSQQAMVAQLSTERETARGEIVRLEAQLAASHARYRAMRKKAVRLSLRLQVAAESDGRVWSRPPSRDVPAFRPLALRRTPILSIVNLKGGVGKTTLTANLSVAWADRGLNVLMIDLDNQGSLSLLTLTKAEFDHLASGQRMIQRVLENPDEALATLRAAIHRPESLAHLAGQVHLVAADERLGDVENQIVERWRAGATGDDVRYRLRALLQRPEIADAYDMIVLDCPPRLTTACINALGASDFVLVPVIPDPISTAGIPRLLRWIKNFRPEVFPQLDVLGVIGNKTKFYNDHPVRVQAAELATLQDHCADAWGAPVTFFEPMRVHDRVIRGFAALDSKLSKSYGNLANEILEELPNHARRRSPSVSPLAARSSGRVGR